MLYIWVATLYRKNILPYQPVSDNMEKNAVILVYVHGHCICVIRALNRNQMHSKDKMELFSNVLHSAGVPEPAVS